MARADQITTTAFAALISSRITFQNTSMGRSRESNQTL